MEKPKKAFKEIVCADPECDTILSRYNPYDLCPVCKTKAIEEIINSTYGMGSPIHIFLKEHSRKYIEVPSKEVSNYLFEKYRFYAPEGKQEAE